jgi:uncharacterized protein (DUF1501 family)
MYIRSRREFLRDTLRSVTALGAVGGMAKFGEMNALAAGGSGYQALVCVFLLGGNDGHNTVIPITTAQQNYNMYQQYRGGLALPQNSLLPIVNGSDTYGLHPSLVEIQGLYNQGKAAVLANVGMLVEPITRAMYLTNNGALVPSALFSHSDQSSQWQTGIPSGTGSSGWGGRITDLLQSQNSGAIFPPVTATSGCQLFCTGVQTFPAAVPPPYNGSTLPTGIATLQGLQNAPATAAGMQQLLSFDNGVQLVQAGNGILARGNNYANTLTGLLANVTLKTAFPANNPLAAQLRTVANVMAVRNQLGLSRQIFFCLLDGFDTHASQLETQTPLLQQLSQAVLAFYQATQELGIDGSVTTFTASEFGRTLTPSGADGSDHAWGNHHFIVGSSVKGGRFYGNFPLLAPGSNSDANTRGVLIPTTAVDQYGSTLAQWFGVPATSLPAVFPNIGNFGTTPIGFLG